MRVPSIRITIIIIAIIAINQLSGCTSRSDWDKAKQAGTYESYQNYINRNPGGEHLSEAQKRADSLYWKSIAGDTVSAPFKRYLEKFPKGQFRTKAETKIDQMKQAQAGNKKTKARVTGNNVIIRSDHTTSSSSAGVVAHEGTVVQILDRYTSGNSDEALLKRAVSVEVNGERIRLPKGKAIRILEDHQDSVQASFITTQFGRAEGTIDKNDIEAIGRKTWYKIRTTDNITGWIYGKFIEEI
ncbi:MAG TPA: SH3 domain-containing protein [Balneolaceae bacterium]|nr:SH3 domain-containing protein [Balneolaceae bacterium]